MQKRLRFALFAICSLCVALTVGCGGGGKKAVSFSNVTVETEAKVGPFGGKYIVIEVKGSATNGTGEALKADAMPSITWDGGSIEPTLSQDELAPKESCDVSWETHLDVKGTEVPELTFSGDVEFEGLDEAQAQLNEQLQAIGKGYSEDEAKKKEEAEKKEAAEAEAERKRSEDEQALRAYVGKSASEAGDAARGMGYDVLFEDSHGMTVNERLEDGGDPEARAAKVTDVKVYADHWLYGTSAVFKLDYEDPDMRDVWGGGSEASAAEHEGPRFKFSDVTVSVLWNGSHTFGAALFVEGNVTNQWPETASAIDLPELRMVAKDKAEMPRLGTDEERVYKLETGKPVHFRYFFSPDMNYSEWEFRQKDDNTYEGLDGVTEEISSKMDAVWEEYLAYLAEEHEQDVAENQTKQNRCYVTPNGSAYHRTQGCRTLSRSDEIIETTRDEAEAKGYVPCDACY